MKMTSILIAALCIAVYGAPSLAEKPSHVKHYNKHERHIDGYRDRDRRYNNRHVRDYDRYRDRKRYSRQHRRHRDHDVVDRLFFGITFGSPGVYRYDSYQRPGRRYGHYKHHRHFKGCGHDWRPRHYRHHRGTHRGHW